MIVLSDTSPLNYMVLIGHVDVLPLLFKEVIVPAAVCDELRNPGAPVAVSQWITNPPDWFIIRSAMQIDAKASILVEAKRRPSAWRLN